jgi:tRNA pseudouridine65 synthase
MAEPPPHIPVIYMDDDIVVVSKPTGMLVHKAARMPEETVVLLQTVKNQIGRWLYPVQRLDRATSGLIAFGLRADAAAALQRSLTAPTCRKEYYVLARGAPPRRLASERPLQDDRGTPQPAHTEFLTLCCYRGCALLRARIFTGRSNQIRRHLNHLCHHALGDTTFGKGRLNQLFRTKYGLPRLFLHATRLCLDHPLTGVRLRLRDRLPADLRTTLHRLEPPGTAPAPESTGPEPPILPNSDLPDC